MPQDDGQLNDFGCGIRFLVPDFISHGFLHYYCVSQRRAETSG